jgi:hypothetical protein
MLNKIGIKDVYKRFKIMDSGFMYYRYSANDHYDFNACCQWVMKKDGNADGIVFLFLSHEMMCVPVNMDNIHWVLSLSSSQQTERS